MAKLLKKRKTAKKYITVGFLTVSVTLIALSLSLLFCKLVFPQKFDGGFVPAVFGNHISEKVKKAEKTELPNWVDVQLISHHSTARTGKNLEDIKNIVIHYVGNPNTSAQNNRNYFEKKDTPVSSHFVVGLEGEVIQCVPLAEMSAASNHRNKDTISIEVCHPDAAGKFKNNTYDALIKLTAFLCNEFSLDEKDVIRHYDITGKICPKYYVENQDAWEQIIKDIGKKLDEY